MALRDGAYLLPQGDGREQALEQLAEESIREGGSAWLMTVQARSEAEDRAYRALFDRAADYAELRKSWKQANRTLATLAPSELTRLTRKLQREYEAVRAIDFFANEATARGRGRVARPAPAHRGLVVARRAARRPAPDPAARARSVPWSSLGHAATALGRPCRECLADQAVHRSRGDASAGWPRRPTARRRRLGFDFDGATFTHVGDRVTFETLMASFGLEGDRGAASARGDGPPTRCRRRARAGGSRLRGRDGRSARAPARRRRLARRDEHGARLALRALRATAADAKA